MLKRKNSGASSKNKFQNTNISIISVMTCLYLTNFVLFTNILCFLSLFLPFNNISFALFLFINSISPFHLLSVYLSIKNSIFIPFSLSFYIFIAFFLLFLLPFSLCHSFFLSFYSSLLFFFHSQSHTFLSLFIFLQYSIYLFLSF